MTAVVVALVAALAISGALNIALVAELRELRRRERLRWGRR